MDKVLLNLGCGNEYREGWTNVDSGNCRKDVDHDLEVFPWPFQDNSVDYAYMQHVLEHLDPNNFPILIKELYRILKTGGVFHAISPHATSDNFNTDFTHKFRLTLRTFDYIDPDKALYENGVIYGLGDYKFKTSSRLVECGENGPNIEHQIIKL